MLKGLALGLPTSQVGGGVAEVCTGIRACAPFSALLLPRVRRGDVGCLLLPRLPPLPPGVLASGSRSSASAALLKPLGPGR